MILHTQNWPWQDIKSTTRREIAEFLLHSKYFPTIILIKSQLSDIIVHICFATLQLILLCMPKVKYMLEVFCVGQWCHGVGDQGTEAPF